MSTLTAEKFVDLPRSQGGESQEVKLKKSVLELILKEFLIATSGKKGKEISVEEPQYNFLLKFSEQPFENCEQCLLLGRYYFALKQMPH